MNDAKVIRVLAGSLKKAKPLKAKGDEFDLQRTASMITWRVICRCAASAISEAGLKPFDRVKFLVACGFRRDNL